MSHHSPGPGWCHTTGSGHIQRDGVRTRVSISVSHDQNHCSVHLCCDHVSPMPMPMWPILGFNVDYVSLVQLSARTHNLSQFRVSKYGRWLVVAGESEVIAWPRLSSSPSRGHSGHLGPVQLARRHTETGNCAVSCLLSDRLETHNMDTCNVWTLEVATNLREVPQCPEKASIRQGPLLFVKRIKNMLRENAQQAFKHDK